MSVYTKKDYPKIYKSVTELNGWEKRLNMDLAFKEKINNSTDFIIISGSISDTKSLNYLRNTIGMITYLIDNGGVGVFDPLTSTFRSSSVWYEDIFNYNASAPRNHIKLYCDIDSKGNKSYYSKGMEKFGRLNISVKGVTEETNRGIKDLINRTIEYLAFGGVIKNKQPIRIKSLPDGMYFEVKNAASNSVYDSSYLEIIWK